jgi:hypothetical protein
VTTSEIQVGGKKNGFTLVVDDAPVPSRGASQKTRARWAIGYVRRIRKGETLSVKLLDQAIKWIDEVVCEAFGREEDLAALSALAKKKPAKEKEFVIRSRESDYFHTVLSAVTDVLGIEACVSFGSKKTAKRFPTREDALIEMHSWSVSASIGCRVEPVPARPTPTKEKTS